MHRSSYLSSLLALVVTGGITLTLTPVANAQLLLSQDFDSTNAVLTAADWNFQNNSVSPSTTFFTSATTTAASGQILPQATTGFAVVNFNSTTSTASTGATISQWMLTPVIPIANGTTVSFFTRTGNVASFADRLVVRLSTAGASTNTGGTATAAGTPVGDFTTTLGAVNNSLVSNGYPTSWTQFTFTITGISAPTTGRVAFNYFVTNGGPNGSNSDIIGIDTIRINAVTAAVTPEPGALAFLAPVLLGGIVVLRRRK